MMDENRIAFMAVILIQAIYAGMFLVSKAAFDVGMNSYIFVFYRQAFATAFLSPIAFYFQWYLFTLFVTTRLFQLVKDLEKFVCSFFHTSSHSFFLVLFGLVFQERCPTLDILHLLQDFYALFIWVSSSFFSSSIYS